MVDNLKEITGENLTPWKEITRLSVGRSLHIACKFLTCLVIIVCTACHIYRISRYEFGGNTCPLLFVSGHWIGDRWQPDGCMMHVYSESEIRTCLQNTRVALVGDSRIRGLYYELAEAVSTTHLPTGKKHTDLFFKDKSNTSIEFYWVPDVDPTVTPSMDSVLKKFVESGYEMPKLIIFGVGTWLIKNQPLTALVPFQGNLRLLASSVASLADNLTNRIKYKDWNQFASRFHREPQIVWIMQDPVVELKLNDDRKAITNEKISLANAMAENVLRDIPHVRIMTATTMMARDKPEETSDGLHYSSLILKTKLNAVLNAFCNDYIFPDDATCCKDIETITKLQYNAFAVLTTCVLFWIVMLLSRQARKRALRDMDVDSDKLALFNSKSMLKWIYSEDMFSGMTSMAKLALIMLYYFLADRSLVYMKAHKHYSHATFFIPIVVMCVGGIATWRPVPKPSVLNSEQLSEWKGWLITIIMLANYTDAESMMPVFVHTRLFYSCFLFILGFEHFKQLWYEGNYGLYKVCKVLAHMNLFCVVSCLVMGRPYQFYCLIPLLSFWFVVIYLVMAALPRVSEQIVTEDPRKYLYVVVKFAVFFGLIFVVWGSEVVSEWLFSTKAIKELFVESRGGIQRWRHRSGLHKYDVIFGMLISFAYVFVKKRKIIDDEKSKPVYDMLLPVKFSAVAVVLSLLAIVVYETQAFKCHSEQLCDITHAAFACILITAFVILRNVPGIMRRNYSALFAWVGDMSPELFVGQYHIWLANDGHGVLELIPGHGAANALVTSFVFVCVTYEVKRICLVLADALITPDVRVMLRRLVFFCAMLLLIWYHKTHERRPTLF